LALASALQRPTNKAFSSWFVRVVRINARLVLPEEVELDLVTGLRALEQVFVVADRGKCAGSLATASRLSKTTAPATSLSPSTPARLRIYIRVRERYGGTFANVQARDRR
jgi:hypothetical protein